MGLVKNRLKRTDEIAKGHKILKREYGRGIKCVNSKENNQEDTKHGNTN